MRLCWGWDELGMCYGAGVKGEFDLVAGLNSAPKHYM